MVPRNPQSSNTTIRFGYDRLLAAVEMEAPAWVTANCTSKCILFIVVLAIS